MTAETRGPVRALPAFCGFAAVGCVLVWVAVAGLLPAWRAMGAGAPLVVADPHDAFGLPLAVSFFALAGMTLFPMPTVGRGRRGGVASRGFDGAAVLLGVAVVAAGLALVASPIAALVMQSEMSGRGYVRCPAVAGVRRAPVQWVLVGSAAGCPVGVAVRNGRDGL